MDETMREMYRSRWRWERERVGLLDIRHENFAKGGIAQFVPNLSVRFVILGADPDCELIDFNTEFWSWWQTNRETPFGTSSEDWGRVTPTTNAAVRYHTLEGKSWNWDSYLAFYRHGGLDMGLGGDGAGTTQEGKRIFRLVRIVGRVWITLDFYRQAVERYKMRGPWECSVSLLKTLDGRLGNFASGWLQYPDPDANPHPCPEPNLWRRWELDEWPAQDATKDIAFAVGAWIENSWGMQCRRFLAHSGSLKDQLDSTQYR